MSIFNTIMYSETIFNRKKKNKIIYIYADSASSMPNP